MKIHESITMERVEDAIRREAEWCENPGFCVACGADADGCEPDAERYECEECGKHAVYGLMYIAMMMM